MDNRDNIFKQKLENYSIEEYDTDTGWNKLQQKKIVPKRNINSLYWTVAASILLAVIWFQTNEDEKYSAERMGVLSTEVIHFPPSFNVRKSHINIVKHTNKDKHIFNSKEALEKEIIEDNYKKPKLVKISSEEYSVEKQLESPEIKFDEQFSEQTLIVSVASQERNLSGKKERIKQTQNITEKEMEIFISANNINKRRRFFTKISKPQNGDSYEQGSSKQNITINL